MKLPYVIIAILTTILLVMILDECQHKPEVTPDRIEVIKERIDTVKVEVVKWKEAKEKIVYKTKFDTLATIDTVYIELLKCDSIVKIDSVIISKQDTIIIQQDKAIEELDDNNQVLEASNKKLKRKLLFTKIVAGAILIISIIAK